MVLSDSNSIAIFVKNFSSSKSSIVISVSL